MIHAHYSVNEGYCIESEPNSFDAKEDNKRIVSSRTRFQPSALADSPSLRGASVYFFEGIE